MPSLTFDPVLYLQMQIARLYRKRHALKIQEFLDLDSDVDVLGYIELGYEPFHLTGEEGVLDEIDRYVASQERIRG
jgi:hypothetical protein